MTRDQFLGTLVWHPMPVAVPPRNTPKEFFDKTPEEYTDEDREYASWWETYCQEVRKREAIARPGTFLRDADGYVNLMTEFELCPCDAQGRDMAIQMAVEYARLWED